MRERCAVAVEIKHPYVTEVEGVAGGKPIIVGTRTPVRSVVAYQQMGDSPRKFKPGCPPSLARSMMPCLSITTTKGTLTPILKQIGKSSYGSI